MTNLLTSWQAANQLLSGSQHSPLSIQPISAVRPSDDKPELCRQLRFNQRHIVTSYHHRPDALRPTQVLRSAICFPLLSGRLTSTSDHCPDALTSNCAGVGPRCGPAIPCHSAANLHPKARQRSTGGDISRQSRPDRCRGSWNGTSLFLALGQWTQLGWRKADDIAQNGGYINPPEIKRQFRDPHADWWDKQERRNYGEPVHENHDQMGMFTPYEYTWVPPAKGLLQIGSFVAVFVGLCYTVKAFYPDKKSYPREFVGGLERELGGPGAVRVSLPLSSRTA